MPYFLQTSPPTDHQQQTIPPIFSPENYLNPLITNLKNLTTIFTKHNYTHKNAQRTQITNTKATYLRLKTHLEQLHNTRLLHTSKKILDYGAGKVHSNTIFTNIDTYEPYPSSTANPTFILPNQIQTQYDIILAVYVLNTIPEPTRSVTLQHIATLLNDGGTAYITTRSSDIHSSKSKQLITDKELITSTGTYQTEFTHNSLQKYAESLLQDGNYSINTFKELPVPAAITITRL